MQIQQAIEIARRLNLIGPVAEQPEYSMLKREKFEVEFEPLWRNEGYGRYIVLVSMIPRLLMLRPSYSTIFSALAAGFLTGKYNDGLPERSRYHVNPSGNMDQRLKYLNSDEGKVMVQKVRELTKVAEELGGSMTNLALAWTLKHPNVATCIVSLPS